MSSHPEVFTEGVLRVTVHHVYYSVTEETLQQVFAAYGVVKISVFQRINHVEAVVQLRSRRGAARALALHGRCIYERACLLDIQDVSPEYNMHLCSLLELKQTATVAEYTTAFWERVHRVLDLNSTLSIKCFIHQYVEGLRTDIQAAVQSQSPSSVTRASSLARIREEEILKDEAMGAEEHDDSYDHGVHGLMPTETLSNVFHDLAAPVVRGADHDVIAIDPNSLAAPTPTTCSTECPSRDATVDIFPKPAASVVHDEAIDIDTVSVMAPTPVTCSTGGLTHGDINSSVAVQMLRPPPWPSFVAKQPSTCRSGIIKQPLSATTASSRDVFQTSSYLHTVRFCAWSQEMIMDDIHREKLCRGELIFWPQPNSETVIRQPLSQAGEISDNKPSCGTITGYQWFVYKESSEVPLTTTVAKVLQFPSNLSNSPGSILVNALCNYRVMWCVDDVYWRLKSWLHIQCVQPASANFEAHTQFVDTSEIFSIELKWETELLSRGLLFTWYIGLNNGAWHCYLVQKAPFSVERHSTGISMQVLGIGSALKLFWSEAAPNSMTRNSLVGGHQLNYVSIAQCVPCCVLEKYIEEGKHIHICATANQDMRLCSSDMEPARHVHRTFILFAHNAPKEEPTYRVIIASYAAGHNLIYISMFHWRFSARGVFHYGSDQYQWKVAWPFSLECSIGGNSSAVKAYHLTTIQALYVCGSQQSSSPEGMSASTVWSGYMDNISAPVTMPWDPGGICRSGLRASRILRGRECHVRLLAYWALSSWALGCMCWA